MFADSDATRLLGKTAVAMAASASALRPPAVPLRQPKFGTHRSKSIDKCSAFEPTLSPPVQTTTAAAAASLLSTSVKKKPLPLLRHSLTFHGAEHLQLSDGRADGGGSGAGSGRNTPENYRKSSRTSSFDHGIMGSGGSAASVHSTAEKVFLEHQLRSYSEQLKNITESVRLYSEQAKLLSDMRSHRAADKHQQQLHLNGAGDGSGSRLLARSKKPPSSLPVDSVYSAPHNHHHHNDVITPSHQLRVFLDNIRSNMQDVPAGGRPCPSIDEAQPTPTLAAGKTPSDQLHTFLDEIRSNYLHDDSDSGSLRTTRTTHAAAYGVGGGQQPVPHNGNDMSQQHMEQLEVMSEQFSPITENCNRPEPEQPYASSAVHQRGVGAAAATASTPAINAAYAVDMNLHKLNSILHACRRKSGHIHTNDAIMFLRACIEGGPVRSRQLAERRWREDVQALLQQPQFDSFNVMVNRINLFVDTVNMQALMSEVKRRRGAGGVGDAGWRS